VPLSTVVRIGYWQAPTSSTQLPPGAAIDSSEPTSEKPTLLPT